MINQDLFLTGILSGTDAVLMRAVSRQFDAMFLIRWDATESQSKSLVSCSIQWEVGEPYLLTGDSLFSHKCKPRLAPVLKTIFINVSFHIRVASLTLMALFLNRAIRVRLATSL